MKHHLQCPDPHRSSWVGEYAGDRLNSYRWLPWLKEGVLPLSGLELNMASPNGGGPLSPNGIAPPKGGIPPGGIPPIAPGGIPPGGGKSPIPGGIPAIPGGMPGGIPPMPGGIPPMPGGMSPIDMPGGGPAKLGTWPRFRAWRITASRKKWERKHHVAKSYKQQKIHFNTLNAPIFKYSLYINLVRGGSLSKYKLIWRSS